MRGTYISSTNLDVANKYRDENGNRRAESSYSVTKEELLTVGIGKEFNKMKGKYVDLIIPKANVTENQLRKEHGLSVRTKYNTD
jgi:hypothetical protein